VGRITQLDEARWVRREEDEMPAVITHDGDAEFYYIVLRSDDHMLLKERIKSLENDLDTINGQFNRMIMGSGVSQ